MIDTTPVDKHNVWAESVQEGDRLTPTGDMRVTKVMHKGSLVLVQASVRGRKEPSVESLLRGTSVAVWRRSASPEWRRSRPAPEWVR